MHGAVRTVASLQGYRQWRKFMIWCSGTRFGWIKRTSFSTQEFGDDRKGSRSGPVQIGDDQEAQQHQRRDGFHAVAGQHVGDRRD